MTTARKSRLKKAMVKKPTTRPVVVTASYGEAIEALAADKDVILARETKKRDEVRVKPHELVQHVRIGKFAFLAYRPDFATVRIRSFVDDQDTGFEHRTVAAAFIHAVAFQSVSDYDFAPAAGGFGAESISVMANAVCRMLGVSNT